MIPLKYCDKVNDAVNFFLQMMAAERGVAKNTLASYESDLKDFCSFIDQQIISQITSHDIRRYLVHINLQGFKSTTVARRLSALRQLFLFAQAEQWIEDNPMQGIAPPRRQKALPKVLTQDEIESLINATTLLKSEESLRLTCLLEMLYATGLRVSELVTLPLSAVQRLHRQEIPSLTVCGKGSKERLVLLSPPALDALQNYLHVRPKFESRMHKDKWLFPSRSASGHLTRQRFGQILKELAITACIDPNRVSPHVVRHAFASHLLHNGADLISLQKLLGHADISTTEIYTHVMNSRQTDLVFNHHPLSKLKKQLK